MKISVYQIDTVTPKNDDELWEICDIIGVPTLKYGTAQMIGKFSHFITKSELKKMKKVSAKFYDRGREFWREGVMLTELQDGKKMFAQYAGKL